MLFLVSMLIACVFSWFCAKPLKKYASIFYIFGAILTVIMCVLGQMHLQVASIITNMINLFHKGTLACAFWCIVAGMGALPNGSTMIKKLMPIRSELSIFSAILTLSHVITYGIVYLQRLLNGRGSDLNFILTCVICLLLVIIMIPLTILSFKTIRKKLNARTWKKIQRLAYLFYALIYVHVILIYIPRAKLNREGSLFSIIIYTVVFASYAIFRIRKEFIKNHKPENKTLLNIICMGALVIATASIGFVSKAKEKPLETSEQVFNTTELTTTEFSTTVSETALELTETIQEIIAITETNSTHSEIENLETENTENNTEISTTAETKTTPDTSSTVTETATATTISEQDNSTPTQTDKDSEIIITENIQNDEPIAQQEEEYIEPEPTVAEPEPIIIEPETDPPVNTIYNDGVFTAEEFGYDSPVIVTITIENDVIIDITATCNESDMYYFEEAYPVIKNRILSSQSSTVDAVSGSTYSSNAIMNGVQKALDSARK